ncbi:MAG: tRNA (guanosine(46)-N7)-methyltransferase TrmB [Chromatiales bacterium]|nr:tRNA (guanosine(46)-N7)-methyltransferase TrmB [Chromatiales bacterium]
MTSNETNHDGVVRSFVRRAGRVTPGQKLALDTVAEEFGLADTGVIDFSRDFGRVAPVWLEIGFGDGDNLVELARRHPEVNLLGLEVHEPGVGRALMGVRDAGLENVRVANADAVQLMRERLSPGTLDKIMLFFPDPWPKKRHHKRRIVQPEFIRLAVSRLRPGGVFHAATDWAPYAEHMLEVLGAEPNLLNTAKDDYAPTRSDRIETKFERRGLRLGHGVWDLKFERAAP